jgi:hypothetical protein
MYITAKTVLSYYKYEYNRNTIISIESLNQKMKIEPLITYNASGRYFKMKINGEKSELKVCRKFSRRTAQISC